MKLMIAVLLSLIGTSASADDGAVHHPAVDDALGLFPAARRHAGRGILCRLLYPDHVLPGDPAHDHPEGDGAIHPVEPDYSAGDFQRRGILRGGAGVP